MTWVLVIGLALGVLVVAIWLLRAPRAGWEALLAVLLLGLAGYALQGRPDLAGAPHAADAAAQGEGALLVEDRRMFAGDVSSADTAPLVMVSDAFVRHGDYAAAVGLLEGAVAKDPRDAQAWLALGNALVAHAGGALSPAATYAYREAEAIAPDAPGVPYFLGLALAGTGQFAQAQALWAGALAKAPADAKWRPVLAQRLARLDRLVAMSAAVRPRN